MLRHGYMPGCTLTCKLLSHGLEPGCTYVSHETLAHVRALVRVTQHVESDGQEPWSGISREETTM